MKRLQQYMKYDYPVRVVRYPDGMFCAEIETIEGLCAYGETAEAALQELETVKETAFELMLSQGAEPPIPKVRLEIPIDVFKKMPNNKLLQEFVRI